MEEAERNNWFASYLSFIESVYLSHDEPWKQSGFIGTVEEWNNLRQPIARCIWKSGSFLDIGCANGYLLECLINWVNPRGIEITPYGVDISEKLINLAVQRLPHFARNFFAANIFSWLPPIKFDYVRTDLVYMPQEYVQQFVRRLRDDFLSPEGMLLLTDYRSHKDPRPASNIDKQLEELGFDIESVVSSIDREGFEGTRIAIMRKPTLMIDLGSSNVDRLSQRVER